MTAMEEMLGETLVSVEGLVVGNEDIVTFTTESGKKFQMQHYRDCCESVFIEDVNGDVEDLIGSPLTLSEEVSSDYDDPNVSSDCSCFTWTFYKLGTLKGTVDIRWFGHSNGYYSESVCFERIQ